MTCESAKCYSTAIYTTIMVVLSLQLLGTIEKQVFDFLGYMWAPIIGNFFQIICTILGIFGTYQYRPKFIAVYSTWSLIWLGWNIFVICLYLEVGVLNRDREMDILSIGTKSKSWWLEHGIGCKIVNDTWVQTVSSDGGRMIPPEEFVEGCILAYYYVEVIHAGIQCLLALTGFVFTLMAIYIYSEEQEPSATNANDELEFVKMNTLTRSQGESNLTPTHHAASNPAYEADAQSTHTRTTHTDYQNDYPTLDRPPSYETSMRNQRANVNNVYGSDRQSVRSARSARSTRSKASVRSKRRREEQAERREELPWVQITPSSSTHHQDSAPYRHFP